MGKKRILQIILAVLLVIINLLVFRFCNVQPTKSLKLSFDVESSMGDTYQVFYGNDENWNEGQSSIIEYKGNGKQKLEFKLPEEISFLRIDLGNAATDLKISNLVVSCGKNKINIDSNRMLDQSAHNQIQEIVKEDNQYKIITNGNDPYVVYRLSSEELDSLNNNQDNVLNIAVKVAICIIIDIIGCIAIINIKRFTGLFYDIYRNRQLIWNLSKSDFKTKYAGSYLGITWAFVQPIVTILVYWFVFQFGLKSGSPIEGVPFVVWFVAGLIPWFFFQDALLNATNCMAEYSYLVKKVVFKISILPIVKGISALFVHLVFIGFLFIVSGVYGFYPSIYSVQLIYYSLCTFCLAIALSYATCAMIVFFKDLGQIINILLQVGMWMTPIMWSYTIIPANLRWIVKLNPMYYIVEGYRDTFINHVWFWNRYFQTIFFWCVVVLIFGLGQIIFKKLKPHFADVL